MSCGSCGSCASCRTASYGSRRGADIIDLDRYMRSAVKPAPHRDRRIREQLVVDAGGVDRAPRPLSDSDSSVPPARPSHLPHPHADRYSHDSGVSDGSYVRRRQKTHRRIVESGGRGETGAAQPSASAAQFRLACEKALREQQEQIARVAELCERLAQPAPAAPPVVAASSDTSSSSSSRSQPRRRDKRRSESCRTYDIIMSKLDELGRLFAARRPLSPSHRRASPRPPSSGSVSVCDKIVATEPSPTARLYQQAKHLQALHVSARCGDSAGHSPQVERLQRCENVPCVDGNESSVGGVDSRSADERVCAACRFYWRAVCRGLALLFAPRTAT